MKQSGPVLIVRSRAASALFTFPASKAGLKARTLTIGLSACLAMFVASSTLGSERAAPTATSAPVTHVIELFTSQGCSACPPAEALLTDLADEPGILPLAYHVDYWDYIGWSDTHGAPENTARQEAYGVSFDISTLYTPQMVIDGRRQVAGGQAEAVREIIDTLPEIVSTGKASVSARIVGDDVKITASMTDVDTRGPMPVLIVVSYDRSAQTVVTRGANRGRTLVETHPVRDWRILGAWSGEPMKIRLPLATLTEGAHGDNGFAIFIQTMSKLGKPGAILAAARLDLTAAHGSASAVRD
ncbi:DUF1223 domain-containing protein [Fulvimarina sp. 2208YS6-2-32]|uniref:DUF1223 domain-containing protein n=1 Tax=Fulvimarina uroteuthidis TaxID=3098149 RepID=A0ABU5HWV3_9HYPH|nr:DUF1223 domain-containing protein [Fulvimarina sp. 2208YS6-2-32]MDY8107614.1 DUF1223 domain-containing protein [Fulvimarina sp. 2208YS6-2-32]